MGPYMAPRHDDLLTQMGAQLVDAGLKMDCALLVEVDDAALRDILQDRMMLGGKQNEDRPSQTEEQEAGNRARTLRIATYNYLAQWLARPSSRKKEYA